MLVKFSQYDQNRDFDAVWEAYKAGSFVENIDPGLGKLQFAARFARIIAECQEALIVSVAHKPVSFVGSYFDGWTYEPHVEFFAWVSRREILEATVEFFAQLAEMDTIGSVRVRSLEASRNLFDHVSRRGTLKYLGMVPKGDYRGDEYIYYACGNAVVPFAGRNPTARYWL